MTRILTRAQIEAAVDPAAAVRAVEQGFVDFSQNRVVVPPAGSLLFDRPPGDLHIRYGFKKGSSSYVVKVASSFYENPRRGLGSSNGVVLVFSSRTGYPRAVLMDEGYLTNLRTGAAGAVAAKHLAPANVTSIGILGSGLQAFFQLDLLRHTVACRKAVLWGRNGESARRLRVEGFEIDVVDSVREVFERCNLVVTTTPSTEPLVLSEYVRPGTHVTAVGADAAGKQELAADLVARADVRAVDSRNQCFDHGDSSYPLKAGLLGSERFVELGEIVARPELGRTGPDQITVADLTGIAVHDIQMAELVCASLGVGEADGP